MIPETLQALKDQARQVRNDAAQMTAKKPTHGGKRKNAGRKPPAEPLKVYSVRLTQFHADVLAAWGAGDRSAGLRGLIDKCLATRPKR